ncbi:MAG: hypothetical protein HOV86_14740, partial [Thermoactinospora sp.]|nr:hypothetical protein [Thermoactinospora sp.]
EPEEATRLLAEAEALRASVGAPLPPGERGDVNRILARLDDHRSAGGDHRRRSSGA